MSEVRLKKHGANVRNERAKANSEAIRRTRREAAEERQKFRNTLSAAQQLARLDARLGVAVGAVRERTLLSKNVV